MDHRDDLWRYAMAGSMSRNKGARGEREVIALLQPVVNKVCDAHGKVRLELKRNFHQRFQPAQYDLDGLPWMAIEIKRCENLSGLGSWWAQVKRATRPGQVPVLIYRQNHGQWQVRTRLPVRVGSKVVRLTINLAFADWLVWFELKLLEEIG